MSLAPCEVARSAPCARRPRHSAARTRRPAERLVAARREPRPSGSSRTRDSRASGPRPRGCAGSRRCGPASPRVAPGRRALPGRRAARARPRRDPGGALAIRGTGSCSIGSRSGRAPSSARKPSSFATRPGRRAARAGRPPLGRLHAAGARRPRDRGAGREPRGAVALSEPRVSRASTAPWSRSTGSTAAMLDLVEVGPAAPPGRGDLARRGTGDGAGVRVHGRPASRRPRGGHRGPRSRSSSARACWAASTTGCCAGSTARTTCSAARAARHARSRARWRFEPALRKAPPSPRAPCSASCRRRAAIDHRALVPAGWPGRSSGSRPRANYTRRRAGRRVDGREISLGQRWPVRRPRPIRARLAASAPLVTGQRALDLLFPVARGSTAAIPGGFGTGRPCCSSRSPSGATPT